jgi:thiamine-phosphate diphosphorylase
LWLCVVLSQFRAQLTDFSFLIHSCMTDTAAPSVMPLQLALRGEEPCFKSGLIACSIVWVWCNGSRLRLTTALQIHALKSKPKIWTDWLIQIWMKDSSSHAKSSALYLGPLETKCVLCRDKRSDGAAFLRAVQDGLEAAEPSGVQVIVNDRVDVAIAAGAHGVHVGQSDMPCAAVRRLVGPSMLIGVSVKTSEQAFEAARAGADYVGAGAVFSTTTKASTCIGLDGLLTIVAASPIPVVAIGGVGADNVADVLATNCAGAAVVSALFGADDVAAAAAELRKMLKWAACKMLCLPPVWFSASIWDVWQLPVGLLIVKLLGYGSFVRVIPTVALRFPGISPTKLWPKQCND